MLASGCFQFVVTYLMTARLAPVLKHFFINVSYHILEVSLTLMPCLKTELSELDWLQVYDMTY